METGKSVLSISIYSNESYTQNSNCSTILKEDNQTLKIVQLTIFSIVLFFGTIFNSTAIWVFCFKMKKFTEARVFMINLLASDCCLLFTVPFRMYSIIQRWLLGEIMCQIIRSVYFMNTYMSIAIITLISVDRYLAIKFPLRSRILRSPKKAAAACGFVWVLLIASRIFLELTGDNTFSEPGFCFRKTTQRPLRRALYFSILGFYVPLPILVFCSLEVIRVLKRKNNASVNEQQCIQKSINIVSTNLLVFLMCFLPVQVGNLVRFVVEILEFDCSLLKNINDYVYAGQTFSDLNCCLDALCYYFVVQEFPEKKSKSLKGNQLYITREQTQSSNL
ncbi:G-protein coupled receptor 35-like [Discoglossus pictus]